MRDFALRLKKRIAVGAVAVLTVLGSMTLTTDSADARPRHGGWHGGGWHGGGWHGGGWRHGGWRHGGWRHGGWGGGGALAAGLIGGLALGAIASSASAGPTYYGAPIAAYGRRCSVARRVYRDRCGRRVVRVARYC